MEENEKNGLMTYEPDYSADVIVSKLMRLAQLKGGVYGLRLFVKLVEYAQPNFRPVDFKQKENLCQFDVKEWGNAAIQFPVRKILVDDEDKNYSKAKQAILKLMGQPIVYEDDKEWKAVSMITSAVIQKKNGIIALRVSEEFWQLMLNFKHGYIQFNPAVAMRFKNTCCFTWYRLLLEMTESRTYRIETLRDMFGLMNKYEKVPDLLKHIINEPKAELDAVSPISFTFSLQTQSMGKRGRKTIVGVTITPLRLVKNDTDDETRKMVHPQSILGKTCYDILTKELGFDFSGLKANIKDLEYAYKNLGEQGFASWLDNLTTEIRRNGSVKNIQGYTISSLRTYLTRRFKIARNKSMPSAEAKKMQEQRRISASVANAENNPYAGKPFETLLRVYNMTYKGKATPPETLKAELKRYGVDVS